MRCPQCGHEEDKVVDSRPSQDGRAIRRRRECLKCGGRYTTYEYVEQSALTVLKSDERREPFDRNKVLHGIKLACNKRPVSVKQMESMVDAIEAEIHSTGRNEIPSAEIGEMVIARLREVDEVAYIRFASVYRDFQDMNEFLAEMNKLRRRKPTSPGKPNATEP
ncbi:transcriptional regulator NrdR [candidate division GN15 bacterium]|uniref:Transcriptional repressor NrdR n=1 Tax=candidate division GN15 bacterium TaxID=2072418 RepID=A0A855X4L4_9BACT|nr:MAG: transcriptional regulator NrdR [candidate division GN15 bacterium]